MLPKKGFNPRAREGSTHGGLDGRRLLLVSTREPVRARHSASVPASQDPSGFQPASP